LDLVYQEFPDGCQMLEAMQPVALYPFLNTKKKRK